MKELIYLDEKYNPKQYRFLDDTFAYDIDRLKEFRKEYVKFINKPYRCTLSPNVTTEDIVIELGKSNCDIVEMGFQTASYKLRSKMMFRYYTNDKVLEINKWLKNNNIRLAIDLIFGTPGETPEDMWETLYFCDKLDIKYTTPSYMYPFPKTKILDIARQMDYIDDVDYERVVQGEGAYHTTFLLKHPHKAEVHKFQALISIYNKAPNWEKPALRKVLKWKYSWVHKFFHFLSVPFNDWYEFRRRVFMIPKMIIKTKRTLKS